ncbi:potassium transporter TrkA [Frankia sp. R43]|uniref:NAD-binding protein n=1 Tax=Frankia sp. R43 TaxID=269536 RepID=UPI0006CA41A0|nr:NAD-binding protein [Frankia sp. R43]KPM51805.1 potassium transporter TrkA [Frankia sp. R43]
MGATGSAHADHVIVCGLNDLGLSIVEQLDAAGVRAVVVDDHEAPGLRRRLERMGVTLVPESGRLSESLHDAGLGTALALITCHDRDLENLQICLVAADSAPRTRIVASISNVGLGEQLQDAFAQVRVRSVGDLAGPGFVEACVRSTVIHAFTLDAPADGAGPGEIFAVVDEEAPTEAPFRALYGDLTPVALRRAGERLAELCPPRDVVVAPGDRLVVMGRLAELRAGGLAVDDVHDARVFASFTADGRPSTAATPTVSPVGAAAAAAGGTSVEAPAGLWSGLRAARLRRAGRVRLRRLRELSATVRAELDRPFRRALAVVTSVMVVSTIVLTLTYQDNNPAAPESFDALDALYLTVETMVTVGFGDYNFGAADAWLQAYGVCLMLFGALSVAVVYAFITNVIISRRLERSFGLGQASTVRRHVILCGLGSVGLATMEGLLRAGEQIVVIERDVNNRYLPVARERGVPVVVGDATVRSTLLEAGVAHAATIAAMTSDGHANLETVLSARETRASTHRAGSGAPLRIVMRVFDATMADEVERRFGIHTARSATALAAPHFLAAAMGHEVISAFYVEGTPFLVARLTIRAGGGLVGPALAELATGTRVLAVTRCQSNEGPQDEAPGTAGATDPAGAAGPSGTTGVAGTAGSADGGPGPTADYRPGRHTRLQAGDELLVVGPVTRIIGMVRRNQLAGHAPAQP